MAALGTLWRFLRPLVPRFWLLVAALLVIGLVDLGASIWRPILMRDFVDALQATNRPSFWRSTALLVGLIAAALPLLLITRYVTALLNEAVYSGLRRELLQLLLAKPLRFFRKFQVGDLVSRTLNDTGELKTFFSRVALQLVFDLLKVVLASVVLFTMNAKLALAMVIGGPLSLLLGLLFQKAIQSRYQAARSGLGDAAAHMQAWLARPMALKAHQIEPVANAAFARKDGLLRAAFVRFELTSGLAASVILGVQALPTVFVFALGGSMVLDGNLSLGTLVAFTAFASVFNEPLQQTLESVVVTLPAMVAVHGRLSQVIAGVEDVPRSPPGIAPRFQRVNVDRVRLDIGDRGTTVSIPDFTVARGEVVGIVGPNGCGKTTFLTTLLALEPPSAGKLTVDIDGAQPLPLRRGLCAPAPQDSVMLDGTFRENMTLFVAKPDNQRLGEIIDALGMDWIHSLPQGLDTVIDAGSLHYLSGGQLQQIGLARAFYHQAPIMVLDEPGTSLDVGALEKAARLIVQQRDRATVVVTHRVEILDVCDRQYEFVDRTAPGGAAAFELIERTLPTTATRADGKAS